MTTAITDALVRTGPTVADETLDPPPWVFSTVGAPSPLSSSPAVVERGSYSLVSVSLPGAISLSALDLQHSVCSLYLSIAETLRSLSASSAVRLWNFIPHIHAPLNKDPGDRLDRYMAFNAGRFAAYAQWYGQNDVGPQVATATGVGHSGADLVVHCLASRDPGRPVENARQVPAYRYSKRRGPLPPCFARATLIPAARTLLVGGTASVKGESSVHIGDLRAQTIETFHNMASLVAGRAIEPGPQMTCNQLREILKSYVTLRIHCVHRADAERVRHLVDEYFTNLESVEYVRADICRRTLMVEIEGTAEVK